MTGQQSFDRLDNLLKNNSFVSGEDDALLKTRLEILQENHESLEQDYASLQSRFKHVEEINEMLKLHPQNQIRSVGLEETNARLLKYLERERSEKEKYQKMVEEMKREESERKVKIDDLRNKNEELLIALERKEEEHQKMEDRYVELAERVGEVEKKCAELKSLYDGQGGKNEAFTSEVVRVDDDHHVKNNSVTDAIVISDESDAENDNGQKESNIILPLPVAIKQEEHCNNGPNSYQANLPSSKVFHPSPSSSSSSSDGYVVLSVKKSKV